MIPSETIDDGDFNPCKVMLVYLIALGVNITMVVVGVQYSESCTIEMIPQFLQIGGGVMFGFTSWYLICSVCCRGEEERTLKRGCAFIIG